MGSVVEYRCESCGFSSGSLRIGWGKAGRADFWGGLARCEPCRDLGVADIASKRRTNGKEPRCGRCGGSLTLLEGTSVSVPCPGCQRPLDHRTLGSWN